jgi:hypothetical protein
MSDNTTSQTPNTLPNIERPELLPTFGDTFLENHAGRIMSDPKVAITELVANCWDAGADRVDIAWPAKHGHVLSVRDNGIGMRRFEFVERWKHLNYNRVLYQGESVQFPLGSGKQSRTRLAFGRNGIGRHAMFCFADEYWVETVKDGYLTRAHVARSQGASPFTMELEEEVPSPGHGTFIHTKAWRGAFDMDGGVVADLIGAQFVADPEFKIFVNGNEVTLTDLEHLREESTIDVPGFGTVKVSRFDSNATGKTSKQHGVAWWVKRRLVGVPTWEGYGEPLLDARTTTAKRYTYVVEADVPPALISPDWSKIYATELTDEIRKQVYAHIKQDLLGLSYDDRRDRKRQALAASRETIKDLPLTSQDQVAKFADELQIQCPTLTDRDLDNAVRVLANLEKSRSGYVLLDKLSRLDPNDLDSLNEILATWSVSDARKVLEELRFRLELIEQLESLVEKHTTDELHDLQPLFERGLWIFGPEFESISFTSNRSLKTVIDRFFGLTGDLKEPSKRPDFVVLPDTSIGVYSSDAFDQNHQVAGIDSVIIVELKRGGFEITDDEKDQALKYAREIRKSGRVVKHTKIVCYVLGTTVDPLVEDTEEGGRTYVYTRTYERVLKQAHARTFNLLQKIQSIKSIEPEDQDLREVVLSGQESFFEKA